MVQKNSKYSESIIEVLEILEILEILASNKLSVCLKYKNEPNLYNLEQTEKRPCD